jgi:DNA (cytosine-5)-methyltransferase 1
MDDVRDAAPNGLRVVSTFSGAGGSCLGFALAGFTTVYASEFVALAADTYAANAPGVPLDRRDIREVSGEQVRALAEIGDAEIDVLEGSPPCASFSACGRGSEGWGVARPYSGTSQRVDDLFWEYARLRDELRPRVFVAENVQGLIRGVSRGYFKEIIARLSEGYRVEARVLDAQWLGVPQARKRVIFIGVRADLDAAPAFPKPLPYRYSIADALPELERVTARNGQHFARVENPTHRPVNTLTADEQMRWEVVGGRTETDPETGERITLDGYAIAPAYDQLKQGEGSDRYLNLVRSSFSRPAPTITAVTNVGAAALTHPSERRKFTLGELRALASFPADFALTGTYRQRAERIGRAVPPLMMRAIATTIRDEVLT